MNDCIARTVAFKPGERNVFFHILTACNLSCRHCYINPAQHGAATVSRQTMERWLTIFSDRSKATNLVFLGGEPTLHPDLGHGIRLARELGYRSVTVDTNGFLFHDFLDRVRPEELEFLSFSLDGPTAEVNDPLRGQGVFSTCTANLKKARDRGFRTSLIYTVSRRNIDQLHKMPELLAELGVQRFFIQVIGLRGQSAQPKAETLQLTRTEWLAVIPEVARAVARQGIAVTFPKVFLDHDEVFQCAGLVAENYFIFPNGRVYLCPLCEDFPVHAYRMDEDGLRKNDGLTEERFFSLSIAEGCVMNKLLQPGNIEYDADGRPAWKISCCLLKQEIQAAC